VSERDKRYFNNLLCVGKKMSNVYGYGCVRVCIVSKYVGMSSLNFFFLFIS